ncbi:hypothetical protein F3J27_12360 [Enterobacter sp. Ap-916]|nr:hypothetical protein [Enterobacter sp. Ap-867]NIG30281.1 hypothetical protein [Enterobacter sp. Ap-916]
MLTKREKAWFFPLCGEQPKINELIFLFFLTSRLVVLFCRQRFVDTIKPVTRTGFSFVSACYSMSVAKDVCAP